MTEQSTQPPSGTASTPPAGTGDPTPAPVVESAGKRYAAYDKTYLRFVGGTHATKKDARDAAKARGVKDVDVREV